MLDGVLGVFGGGQWRWPCRAGRRRRVNGDVGDVDEDGDDDDGDLDDTASRLARARVSLCCGGCTGAKSARVRRAPGPENV